MAGEAGDAASGPQRTERLAAPGLAGASLETIRLEFDRELARLSPAEEEIVEAAAVAEPPFDLGQLLSVPSHEFLRLAYRRILGRLPDESGAAHLTGALGSGTKTRVDVLRDLRYSAEGQAKGRSVPGLRRKVLVQRIYRLPVIGRLLRIPGSLLAIPGMIRGMNAMGEQLQAQQILLGKLQDQAVLADERHLVAGNRLEEVGTQGERSRARLDRLAELLGREPWAEPILALSEKLDRQVDLLEAGTDRLDRVGRQEEAIASVGLALDAARRAAGWDEEGDALAERLVGTLERHRHEFESSRADAERQRIELAQLRQRSSIVLAELRRLAGQVAAPAAVDRVEAIAAGDLDALYVQFEDIFRGTRADIKQRQAAYLAVIRESGAGGEDRPILDVGSGRGELLELLTEHGLRAQGVDMNATMVGICRAQGLDCVQGDAVAHLASLEEGSLGAVTGFHIVEHLPFGVLVALLDESLRALSSGGLILFETPNPANLLTSSRWFYLDPTHRNPLPGEMLAMIAEARGFVDVSIRETNPSPRRFAAKDHLLAEQLDTLFHGPQDYALIARKP